MPVAFSHLTDHTLDSAVESGELTADVPAFLRACAPGDTVIETLVKMPKGKRTDLRKNETDNQWLCRQITDHTDVLIAHLGPRQDRRLLQDIWTSGIVRAASQARSVARHLAYCAALDVTGWGDYRPMKTKMRRAYSLRQQRRWLAQNEFAAHFVPLYRRLLLLGDQFKVRSADYSGPNTPYDFQALQARMEYYGRLQVPGEASLSRAPTAEQRAALRRAIALARTLVGEHALYSFLRGDTVHVLGTDFGFAVKKQNLFRLGHGAIGITLCDHALEPLADLCVYFEATPAIDQLVALRLHCEAGMDADILYDANVMREYPAAAHNADYQAVRALKAEDARVRAAVVGTVDPIWNRVVDVGDLRTNTVTTSQPRWVSLSSTNAGRAVIDASTRSNFILQAYGTHTFTAVSNTAAPSGTGCSINATAISNGTITVSNASAENLRIERCADGQLRIFIPARPNLVMAAQQNMAPDIQFHDRKTGERYWGNLAYEAWSEDWFAASGLTQIYEERIAEAVLPRSQAARALLGMIRGVDGADPNEGSGYRDRHAYNNSRADAPARQREQRAQARGALTVGAAL